VEGEASVPVVKRIVCFANSRKKSGRCIAGREMIAGRPGGWIRPVSAREQQEVSWYERQYPDGSDPSVLDIIDVPLLGHRPHAYQQENWLLDPDLYWEKAGGLGWDDLGAWATPTPRLWVCGHSTQAGCNDQVPVLLANGLQNSLCLIRVDRLDVRVCAPGDSYGSRKRRVQGRFGYRGVNYGLWITDPRCEARYLAQPNGSYEIGESYLTISLGEPFHNMCYKLIAAVIERE
jgi:hypothetical protein